MEYKNEFIKDYYNNGEFKVRTNHVMNTLMEELSQGNVDNILEISVTKDGTLKGIMREYGGPLTQIANRDGVLRLEGMSISDNYERDLTEEENKIVGDFLKNKIKLANPEALKSNYFIVDDDYEF